MTVLPEQLDRRYEAVVLVGDAPHPAGVEAAVAAARAGGLRVAHAAPDAVTAVLDDLWRQGIGPSGVLVVGGPESDPAPAGDPHSDTVQALLEDQLRRRRSGELPHVAPEPGWGYAVDTFDAETERVSEALLASGDGRVGATGAPLAEHPSTRPTMLVSGVYDGDGPDSRLLSAPLAFRLPYALPADPLVRRQLDLRTGLLREDELTTRGPLSAVRFTALARPGTTVLRARCPEGDAEHVLLPPMEGRTHDEGTADGCRWMRVAAPSGGIAAAAATATVGIATEDRVLDVITSYVGDAYRLPEAAAAVDAAQEASRLGFEQLLDEQRSRWAARWQDADVSVEGDSDLQLATRLALFHLMGSVGDEGEAAVGARGLTGQGYGGHVFWDADTFVLPFFAATHPPSARAMLEYRLQRLSAALVTARAEGREGARFPWESARTGYDVTPPTAYDRAGQLLHIRTGAQEVHIVAQVAWAACHYLDWTGDQEFARGGGLTLLVETARYWASRVELDGDGSAHLRGVIGPDEYHEDVDDDAFTNVMARWNLRRAADAVDAAEGAGPDHAEVRRWRDLAAALVDGFDPETGRHEQFRGFWDLEPLVIAEVAPRRPIAADVLMGRERVQGSQVVKQPAVLMLHHLLPEELPPGSLRADLAYYEPRTAHGSSLSPGVHAALLARVGKLQQALRALEITANIDLHDLTGSTASGFHLATAGGLWQALVLGFAGVRPSRNRLLVDPHVPPAWGELGVRLRFRGSAIELRCTSDRSVLVADPPVPVTISGEPVTAGPAGLRLARNGDAWEMA